MAYAELYRSKSNALIVETNDEFAELVEKIKEKKLKEGKDGRKITIMYSFNRINQFIKGNDVPL